MLKRESFRSFLGSFYNKYRWDALSRNLAWQITKEEFTALVIQNCHYCGSRPKRRPVFDRGIKYKSSEKVNGIDRKDNLFGYVLFNLVPCCTQCNFFKKTLSVEEFLKHVSRIHKHSSKKVP